MGLSGSSSRDVPGWCSFPGGIRGATRDGCCSGLRPGCTATHLQYKVWCPRLAPRFRILKRNNLWRAEFALESWVPLGPIRKDGYVRWSGLGLFFYFDFKAAGDQMRQFFGFKGLETKSIGSKLALYFLFIQCVVAKTKNGFPFK